MKRIFWTIFSIACLLMAPLSIHAEDASGENTRLLLSHLPLKTSRAYHRLLHASGGASREVLPMTKAETWVVPSSVVLDLRRQAEAVGVTVTILDGQNFDALHPMQTEHMTAQQSAMMHDAMKDRSTMGVSMMTLAAPEALEYALTRSADEHGELRVRFQLSKDVTVVATRRSLMKEGDSYIWQGELDGTFEPVTLVYWPQGRLTGTIQHAGRLYTVKSFGGGMHGVVETAPAMLPPEHAPLPNRIMKKFNMRDDPLKMKGDAGAVMEHMSRHSEDLNHLKDLRPAKPLSKIAQVHPAFEAKKLGKTAAASTITVIVAYSHAAASHYQDIRKDLIDLAIAEANMSFLRSGIENVRLEVVHSYETSYVEQGSHFDHMYRFAEKGDGYADEIHGLRDKYHADIAVMIVDDANGCGLSAGVAPSAERAFAVVHHGCAATTYSLAHEIGHIIGARHDIGYDDSATPYPFGHGYVNARKWRTMMSYEQSCDGCPRLPLWSSPDLKVQNESAGSENTNNARVIREGAARVALFR